MRELGRQMHIYRRIKRGGIEIKAGRKSYSIVYPSTIWQEFPEVYRQIFADSLTYFLTMHLSLVDTQRLVYHFPPPVTEPFFFKGLVYSLPETILTENNKETMSSLLRLLYNSSFRINYTERPRYARFKNVNRNSWKRALIPFSFGKDSLLTFALAQELGIKPYPIFFREPRSPYENKHKARLADRFFEEFDIDINFFPVSAGWLRQIEDHYWGWDLLLTQYSLLLIPFIFGTRSRYLFWANEQSCNETFVDKGGFIVNPVFEQSYNWLLATNAMAKILGCNAIFASLIEPIHEIAIMKILHSRYPEIGRYQMSCFSEEKEAKNKRWCGVCSKCARMYIFMLALGINPKRVGFFQNMLTAGKKHLFAVFPDRKSPLDSAFDQSSAARDEQLLAFTMAKRRGVKGSLMKQFERLYGKEGKKREKELRQKYFGIHTTNSITYELRKPLLSIFNEELKRMR
ncbi:hypothetical protein FJY90_07415 [Candidatus Gottesmanbacteria bacterium]|nr:hypothetical protein [Candidatus Gottesmanbacteria bacterium]